MSPTVIPWRSEAALAALALGENETALHLSERELELARQFGAPRALGIALRAAGLVAGGTRAEQLLEEAVGVLKGADNGLELARALTDLGALLRRGKRRLEARALLPERWVRLPGLGLARSHPGPKSSCAQPERSRDGSD